MFLIVSDLSPDKISETRPVERQMDTFFDVAPADVFGQSPEEGYIFDNR